MADRDVIEMLRDSARRFADGHQDHAGLRAGRNVLPWKDAALVSHMAELGWFATLIPETLGGAGLDLSAIAGVAHELGRGLLGEAVVPLAVLAPLVLRDCPDGPVRSAMLTGIADGSAPVAVAWQETGTSVVRPFDGDVKLERSGDGWRLTGEKRFVASAWAARSVIVAARGVDGPSLVRVDLGTPGVTLDHEWRADGSPTGRLSLDALIDETDILARGPVAEAALRAALDGAAIIVAAELDGVMSAALDITLAYLKTRTAFGRPIAAFQALQHRAARLYVHREIARAVIDGALDAAASDPAQLPDWASRAKARANDAGIEVTRQAIQLHGAIGFTDECDIGLYLKRALVLSAWLGTTAEHQSRLRPYDLRSTPKGDAGGVPVLADPPEDWNSVSDEEFRAYAAAFFARHLPENLRFRSGRLGWAEIGDWYLFLSARGWLVPGWPRDFGGMGLSPSKHLIYYEEMERAGAPRLLDHGINNVGSILIERGTPEQQQEYLPKVLSGEHIWCQGYSEPNAGSDLASLRTEARIDGDELVIRGQKIWTTLAHEANHMYALVRTDPARPGRDGISFVLIDLRQPGVTIRPIRNIAGHTEFCEVFLEDVRAPLSDIVGALHDGWAVSRAVLGFERLRVGAPRNAQMALGRLIRASQALGLETDPILRDRIVGFTRDVDDLAALYRKAADALAGGVAPGPEASVLKIWATETEQALTEALVCLLGDRGTLAGPQDIAGQTFDPLTPFLSTRATTIYGGTNEIQLNIIAKRVLGL